MPSATQQLIWAASPAEFMRDLTGRDPYAWQVELLEGAARRRLANVSRQSGKTETACFAVAHQMLFRPTPPDPSAVVVTHRLDFSAEFVRRVRFILQDSGVAPKPWPLSNVHRIELPNGGRLIALPATEATRGYAKPRLLVMDEAAQIPDAVFAALTPTQAAIGAIARLWAISTPFGQRGWWWRVWERGGADWQRTRRQATEIPHITEDFLRVERINMGSELRFRSEYLCEFVGTESQVFPPELLARMFGPMPAEFANVPDLFQPTDAEEVSAFAHHPATRAHDLSGGRDIEWSA